MAVITARLPLDTLRGLGIEFPLGRLASGAPCLAGLTEQRLAHQANCPRGTLGGQLHSFVAAVRSLDQAGSARAARVFGRTVPQDRVCGRKLGAPIALVISLVFSSGCSGASENLAAPTTAPTSPSQPPATTAAAQDAITADIVGRYKQFWEVRFEANQPPVNPSDPRLSEFATGQQLDNVLLETRQRRDQGLALRRPEPSVYERRVKLTRVDGDSAELQDCATNDGIVYRVATGEVVDDSVVTRSISATMRLVDGTWRLSETRVVQEWEGVAGCAKSSDFS